MKNLIVLALCLFSLNSFAQRRGPGDGGGGKGIVCRNADGSEEVRLLDLWEAERVWEREIMRSELPVETQLDQMILNLEHAAPWKEGVSTWQKKVTIYAPDFVNKIKQRSSEFLRMLEYINKPLRRDWVRIDKVKLFRNATLEFTQDSYETVTPKNCKMVQIVRYEDDVEEVKVDLDLLEKMPKTDQAALILHEVFYRYLRTGGTFWSNKNMEPNSLRTRRAVGLVASGYKFEPVEASLKKGDQYLACYNTRTSSDQPYHLVYLIKSRFAEAGCYDAIAGYINDTPILGQPPINGSSCIYKNKNIKDRPYLKMEELIEQGRLKKAADKDMNHWFNLNPGLTREFDENGKMVPRRAIEITADFSSKNLNSSGLKAIILESSNDSYKNISPQLECYARTKE